MPFTMVRASILNRRFQHDMERQVCPCCRSNLVRIRGISIGSTWLVGNLVPYMPKLGQSNLCARTAGCKSQGGQPPPHLIADQRHFPIVGSKQG